MKILQSAKCKNIDVSRISFQNRMTLYSLYLVCVVVGVNVEGGAGADCIELSIGS